MLELCLFSARNSKFPGQENPMKFVEKFTFLVHGMDISLTFPGAV